VSITDRKIISERKNNLWRKADRILTRRGKSQIQRKKKEKVVKAFRSFPLIKGVGAEKEGKVWSWRNWTQKM